MDNSTTSATTFKVSDKAAERVKNSGENETGTSICSQLRPYRYNHCRKVLMETQFSSSIRPSENNGFVRTVIDCYNNHHNLIIRPDDIWTAILTQFSFYINKNAEEFRGQFVDFDGKRELVVSINGSLCDAPYDLFVTSMTKKIDENLVDKSVKDWILPNFTTSTPNDVITCGTIFMAVTQKYFDFMCMLLCGIPNITLEGTLADWENILNRLEKLKAYKLDKWYDMLKSILEEFVAAKQGRANTDFWNRICHHLGGGSGPTYISGWLTAFAVFDENGNWTDNKVDRFDMARLLREMSLTEEISQQQSNEHDEQMSWPVIDIDKIPTGIVTVNVKISDGSADYDSIMFAGHVGYDVPKGDGYTLKPEIGWGIALKMSADEIETLHETARKNGEWSCGLCYEEVKTFDNSPQ
ncbi:hypothetical protein Bhyg_17475 [Pseudolycoriella hygida]|uniref:DUF4419 domain-containing protein n=1 Tax=Pseudolycoriella hygida TaxID=35572 RepID=A0A9Q0MKK0_9DIPT|nr:hypothetical protein Bhyg_17475 [Pseudolycoriella hygida]